MNFFIKCIAKMHITLIWLSAYKICYRQSFFTFYYNINSNIHMMDREKQNTVSLVETWQKIPNDFIVIIIPRKSRFRMFATDCRITRFFSATAWWNPWFFPRPIDEIRVFSRDCLTKLVFFFFFANWGILRFSFASNCQNLDFPSQVTDKIRGFFPWPFHEIRERLRNSSFLIFSWPIAEMIFRNTANNNNNNNLTNSANSWKNHISIYDVCL